MPDEIAEHARQGIRLAAAWLARDYDGYRDLVRGNELTVLASTTALCGAVLDREGGRELLETAIRDDFR